jgi:F420-0:gamma-glutamyl ligase
MNDELSSAGQLLAGKEGERSPQEVVRKAKLKAKTDATAGSTAKETAIAAKRDENEAHDEFYSDVLARFGIQI